MQRWVWCGLSLALLLPACGDDAGSGNNNDLNNNHAALLCGNGTVDGAEECDDGPANSDAEPDACRTDCVLAHCGDGITDDGEDCDDGVANSDVVPDACRQDCSPPACGDLVVDVQQGENCDDGNTEGGDGCNPQCFPEYCGNGYLEAGEVCDDGNFDLGDGCSANCQSNETCGNGVVDFAAGETCDDGNAGSHDGCASSCTAEVPVWTAWWHGWGTRREHATAYYTTRGGLVLFGGLLRGALNGDTWYFDSVRWWRVSPWVSPSARRGHTMIYDPYRDRLVLFGGEGVGGALADTWEFNGWTWKPLSPAVSPPARLAHGMIYDSHRRRVVVYGGLDGSAGNRLGDTWELDGETWTQRPTAVSPPPLDGASFVYDPGRRVAVLFGGESDSGLSDETWELQAGGWVQRMGLAPIPPARRSAAAAFGIFTLGILSYTVGTIIHSGLDDTGDAYDDLWVFDGTDWIQRSPGNRPSARYGHSMTYSPSDAYPSYGHITMVGGEPGANGVIGTEGVEADTWTLGLTNWSRKNQTFLPDRRDAAVLAWDSDRRQMVLYGGDHFWGVRSDTWVFNELQWIDVTSGPTAGPRAQAAMAYHAARQEMVIFGGRSDSTTLVGTTATYSDYTWTVLPVGADPQPRRGHAMAYDPVAEVVVLFGGDTGAVSDETWEWDGTWSQITTAQSPIARAGHRMVWDEDRQRIVLFGGTSGVGLVSNDTWEYDGTNWVELSPAQTPDGRYGHGMAYHELRKRVVVFGGAHGVYEQDTWEHDPDGGLWWAIGTAEAPAARSAPAMAYNPEVRGVQLFGGDGGGWIDPFLGDTWFYGYSSTLPEEQCDNGVDDDTDLRVDCDDPDCDGRPCGTAGGECAGGVCACAGGTTETVCGDWLDDDCDGQTDCADADCAGAPGCETVEQSCLDVFDNDGDGLWDCGDPDCHADPACAQTLCTEWMPLQCGAWEFNTTVDAPANSNSYGCPALDLPGPETSMRFVAPANGTYTASLVQLTNDLRLVVVGTDTDGACDPTGTCLGVSPVDGSDVTFTAVAGQVLFFMADGPAGGGFGFTISVSCP